MKNVPMLHKVVAFVTIISLIFGCYTNVYASFSDETFTDANDYYQEQEDALSNNEENDESSDTSVLFNDLSDNEGLVQEEFSDNAQDTLDVLVSDDNQKTLEIGQKYELSLGPNDNDHRWMIYSSYDQICALNLTLINENDCLLKTTIYAENTPDEILYTFDGVGDYQIEFLADTTYFISIESETSTIVGLTIQPELDVVEINNITFQESSSQINSEVKKLLSNTNNSGRPLSEYDDPINITVDFSQSAEGVVQNFFRQYGSISSKNRVWRMKYEEVLVDLLSDDSFLKLYKDARIGDLEDFAYSMLGEIADESSETMTSVAGKIVKIERATLQDMLKAQIVNDTEKIYILSIIEEYADDKNLKTACKNCMSHYFSSSMDAIWDVLVDTIVSKGIKKAVAVETVTNQILNQKLKKTYLEKMVQKLSIGTVASTVMEILLIKDALSFLTGINARVDAYLKTVALNFIYETSISAYGNSVNGGKSGNNDDTSKLYAMFNFGLQVKQEAYKTMASIYTSSTWKKIVASDPYLKTNISMIKTFTIGNYKKVTLGKLTPKCPASSITINLNGKRNFPLADISYLAEKGYASKNKKVASVNSSGVISGKKVGTTYVACVVDQYGEKCKLICKINVVKPSISLNKKTATIYTDGNKKTLQLTATVIGQSKTTAWKSSNPSVASVDKNGKVVAKKEGSTTITVTANRVKYTCIITVINIKGIWLKEKEQDPLKFIFNPNGTVKYYFAFSHENDYTTRYKVSGNILTINFVNIDFSGITPLKYKLVHKRDKGINKIYMKSINNDVDVSKLFGYEKYVEGWYRQISH